MEYRALLYDTACPYYQVALIKRKSTLDMSHFAYACKTEGENGISRLISELLHTLDSSLRDRLFDVTEWRTVAYPGDFWIP